MAQPAEQADAPRRGKRRMSELLTDFDRLVTVQRARIAASRARAARSQAGLDSEQVARLDKQPRADERQAARLRRRGDRSSLRREAAVARRTALGAGPRRQRDPVRGPAGSSTPSWARRQSKTWTTSALEMLWNYVGLDQWRHRIVEQTARRRSAQAGGEKQAAGHAAPAPAPAEVGRVTKRFSAAARHRDRRRQRAGRGAAHAARC